MCNSWFRLFPFRPVSSFKLQNHSADWILPVVKDPIKNGAVVSSQDSILFVGDAGEASTLYPEAEKIHHAEKSILPGLVNAHCHLNHCTLKNRLPLRDDETLFDWIGKVISEKTETSEDEKIRATLEGIQQCKESGTVALADIITEPFVLSLLEEPDLTTVCFHETTGFLPEQAEAIFLERLSYLEELQRRSAMEHFLSPHSPYSISRELLEKIARTGSRTSFHLAESREEVEFLKKGHPKMEQILKSLGKWDLKWKPPGLSPVRYFYDVGLLRENSLAVHMVCVGEEDYPVLEKSKPNIALCLRSNTHLRNGLPPVRDYLELGLNLCLGTDGLGSNEDLSLLNEMQYVKKCFPDLDDAVILQMATLGGAKALGLEEQFGSLEPGKSGKFMVVGCEGGPYGFLVGGSG